MAINKTDSVSKAKTGSAKKFGKTEKSLQAELSLSPDAHVGTELVAEAPSTHEIPADIQSWLAEAQSAWKKQQTEEERLTLEQENGARVVYLADAAMAGNTMTDTGNMLLAQNTSASAAEVESESESKAALLPDEIAFNPAWLGLGLLGLAGGGGGGGGGSAIDNAASNLVNGVVVLGPVLAGHELTVNVYAANGTTLLGTAILSSTGTFSVDVGSYTGVVIAKLVDSGTGVDFMDEATGVAKDLSAELMTVGVANAGVVTLNINALTTIAAREAGAVFSGGTTGTLTAEVANNANAAVADAFGLADILTAEVVTTINSAGTANTAYDPTVLSDAEKYGAVLAALSGVDSLNAGDMQQTIDDLVAAITVTGSAGVIDQAALDVVIAGANTVADTSAGTGGSLLTAVVSDLTQQVSASVAILDVSTDDVISDIELATVSGTNSTGATVTLTIGGASSIVVIADTATTWHYDLTSTDLVNMGVGGETIIATASLSGGGTAEASRSIVQVQDLSLNHNPAQGAPTLMSAFRDEVTDITVISSIVADVSLDVSSDTTPTVLLSSSTISVTASADSSSAMLGIQNASGTVTALNVTASGGSADAGADIVTGGALTISAVNVETTGNSTPGGQSHASVSISGDVTLGDFITVTASGNEAHASFSTSATDAVVFTNVTNGITVTASSADAVASMDVFNATGTVSTINVQATAGDFSKASVDLEGSFTILDSIAVTTSGSADSKNAHLQLGNNNVPSDIGPVIDIATVNVTASGNGDTAELYAYNASGTVSSITVLADNNGATASAYFNQNASAASFTLGSTVDVTASALWSNAYLNYNQNDGASPGVIFANTTLNVTASGNSSDASFYANKASGTIVDINLTASGSAGDSRDMASANIHGGFTINGTVTVLADRSGTDSSADAYLQLDSFNNGVDGGIVFANAAIDITASAQDSYASVEINSASGTVSSISVTTSDFSSNADVAIYGDGTHNITVTDSVSVTATYSNDSSTLTLGSQGDIGVVFSTATLNVEASIGDGAAASMRINEASGTLTSVIVTASVESSEASLNINRSSVDTTVLTIGSTLTVSATSHDANAHVQLDNDSGNHYQALARLTDGTGAIADGTYTLTVGATTLTHTITGGNGSIGGLYTAFNNTMNALYPDAGFEIGTYNNGTDSGMYVTGTDFAAHAFTIQRTGDAAISSAVSQDVVAPTTIAFNNTAISVTASGDSADVSLSVSGAVGTITDITVQSSGAPGSDSDSADASISGNFTINGNITVQAQGADNNGSDSADAILSLSGDVTFDTVTFQATASGLSAEAGVDIENAHGTLSSITVTSSGRFASADVNFSNEAGTSTLNVGDITVTATNHEAEANLNIGGYQGRSQQQTLSFAIDTDGNVAAGVYTLNLGGMTVSYEMSAPAVNEFGNYVDLYYGLQNELDRIYGENYQPVYLDNYGSVATTATFEFFWNDTVAHASNNPQLLLPSTTVVNSVLSQVAVEPIENHLANSVISVTASGVSADANLYIANATGQIDAVTVTTNNIAGGASAEIVGVFTVNTITVESAYGSADLVLGGSNDSSLVTLNDSVITVTAGTSGVAADGHSASASLYINNVEGAVQSISVTTTGMSGDALAELNGDFAVTATTLNITAVGKHAEAVLKMYGAEGSTDLPAYDVTLTNLAINVDAQGFASGASLDLADATGVISAITVIASGEEAEVSADIDFSGNLNGDITVNATGNASDAYLYMTAGTPTQVGVNWTNSSATTNPGLAFATGQIFTLKVGSTELSYTLQNADIVNNNIDATLINLVNGLKTDSDYANADFELLHPGTFNSSDNQFNIVWKDATAINRDFISMTRVDVNGTTNLTDEGFDVNYFPDHDGTVITLGSDIDITANADGAGSSAEIELDNLFGTIDTITASATGGNLVGTLDYFYDAFDALDNDPPDIPFIGASADVIVRVTGGVNSIIINAENIEDTALVALSQTVQGGTATVSGDGRTSLTLGNKTVDTINLSALHTGTWGAFDLNLAMADAAYGAVDSTVLTNGMITINNFVGDRDAINIFKPYDQSASNWAWNSNNSITPSQMLYSEDEVNDAGSFANFLVAAEFVLGQDTSEIADYYFGVVGSDGYLAYDIGGTGITGVVKLAGVTSFDAANLGYQYPIQNLATQSGTINDSLLYEATRLSYVTGIGGGNAADLVLQYETKGRIDELNVGADVTSNWATDVVDLMLTEGAGGDIYFRQAKIDVSAKSEFNSSNAQSYGAAATLTVSGARGTIEHIGVHTDGWNEDSSSTATFMSFSGAVQEIDISAIGHGLKNASADLNLYSTNSSALTESVQNLWINVESADASANLTLSNGFVVQSEVNINSSSDISTVTLNIEQTVHGGDVFATSFLGDSISGNGAYATLVPSHATFDLTYNGATAEKVSLGQRDSADVFTVGNFEGEFKLTVNVADADNVDFTAGGALQTNMLTIAGFDTGGTAYDAANAWLDDTISFNNAQAGGYTESLTDATTVGGFLANASAALDGTVDYYFGVVGSNGYLAMDEDGSGITQVIEFLNMTDLDYTRISGATP